MNWRTLPTERGRTGRANRSSSCLTTCGRLSGARVSAWFRTTSSVASMLRSRAIQLKSSADNGSPMTGKRLIQLLADLGITKSHSRPHSSDDNPFSEAQFKTMKYRPDYPDRFASIDEARSRVTCAASGERVGTPQRDRVGRAQGE